MLTPTVDQVQDQHPEHKGNQQSHERTEAKQVIILKLSLLSQLLMNIKRTNKKLVTNLEFLV